MHSKNMQKTISALLVTCAFIAAPSFAATKTFAAVITTNETLSGPLPSPTCPFTGESFGTGSSNLFSKSANVFTKIALKAKDCVYLQPLSTPDGTIFIPTKFDQGEFTLTSESTLGQAVDSITARHEGTLTLNQDGTFTLNGTFTVVSGTGKYANANGSGLLTGTEIINGNMATGNLKAVGRINY